MNIIPKSSNKRKTQLEWTNALVHIHDLICDCNQPLEHTIDTICTQEPSLKLNLQTSHKIKKCLTTTETTEKEDTVDGLDAGTLEALFAEDIGEDTG